MDRRQFFQLFKAASCSYLVLRVAGCTATGTAKVLAEDPNSLLVYDLIMQGFSNPDGEYLGDNGTLLASQIRDDQTVTLPYVQDDDGHTFTLTPDHFAALMRGETVTVITTIARDHNHQVHIDPANHAPGSAPLTVEVDGEGRPVGNASGNAGTATSATTTTITSASANSSAGEARLFAGLSEGQQPNLFVSGTKEMVEGSVEYCVDDPDDCDAEESLWQTMSRSSRKDIAVFVSDDVLGVDPTQESEVPVSVRGQAQSDGQLVTLLLNLVGR
jgi:hypothetical protein